jgi:hypothetical protein
VGVQRRAPVSSRVPDRLLPKVPPAAVIAAVWHDMALGGRAANYYDLCLYAVSGVTVWPTDMELEWADSACQLVMATTEQSARLVATAQRCGQATLHVFEWNDREVTVASLRRASGLYF